MIAFGEAFTPAFGWIQAQTGLAPETWMFSLPATVLLLALIIKKGADLGVTALWGVAAMLVISLGLFFLGESQLPPEFAIDFFGTVEEPDGFFTVFAILFPAFTGMTAGVGLSGDLKNPRRSISLGYTSCRRCRDGHLRPGCDQTRLQPSTRRTGRRSVGNEQDCPLGPHHSDRTWRGNALFCDWIDSDRSSHFAGSCWR